MSSSPSADFLYRVATRMTGQHSTTRGRETRHRRRRPEPHAERVARRGSPGISPSQVKRIARLIALYGRRLRWRSPPSPFYFLTGMAGGGGGGDGYRCI